MGRYQGQLILILALINYLQGCINFIAPYIFYQEPYSCPNSSDEASCYTKVCSLPLSERSAYIPESSIYSIPNQFGDFRCEGEKYQIDWIISFMLFGKVAASLIIAFIGDWFSRKTLSITGLSISLTGLIIALLQINLVVVGLGLFVTLAGV